MRIVAYNIEADITLTNKQSTFTNIVNVPGPPVPGLIAPVNDTNNFAAGGTLEGIGEEVVRGNAQPLDILALEETTSNPGTIAPIVNALNTFYGIAGMYTNSSYQSFLSSAGGNGPNAVVFNKRTVQLLASTPVDPPGGTSKLGSSSGEYREVMRYQFAPAGVATNGSNTFYLYVSHYKSSASGSLATNEIYRNEEAQIVRSNTAALSATARILHVGDFNTGDTTEPMYSTLIAPGTNQFLDPINPSNSIGTDWDNDVTAYLVVKTESSTSLHYRDDYQMMTTNIYYGSGGGMALVSGTYHLFGNNGSVNYEKSVSSGTDTALNNNLITNGPVFISPAQLYIDLTGGSDHLPVVADYTIPLPVPAITGVRLMGTNLVLSVTNGVTNAVYSVLIASNLLTPRTNWTAVANYTATNGAFTFKATNVIVPATQQRFYILKGK